MHDRPERAMRCVLLRVHLFMLHMDVTRCNSFNFQSCCRHALRALPLLSPPRRPSAQRAILSLGHPCRTRGRGARQGLVKGHHDDGQRRAAGAGSDRAMHAHLHAIRGGADEVAPRVGRGACAHAGRVAEAAGGATLHLRILALALPTNPWPHGQTDRQRNAQPKPQTTVEVVCIRAVSRSASNLYCKSTYVHINN